ncbi:hypothetical protein [Nostoc sp. FACHB-280]|uniref:hypothetical protein n=1 Tax=Nostoc sp. FACHB-280 TaxID=2692839 RepID=UPI00168B373C|nr:hypothetical protein [Nostoc sp. FACHB-280]MBD2495011.1 hypothetical protein [Nostoc sp. FACHB-280]
MTFPATTQALKQLKEATDLASEFKKYADGLKDITQSRALKSQISAIKNGLTKTSKTASVANDLAKKANTAATNAKKITDLLQQGAFKKINPSLGSRFSNFLAVLNAGATTWLIKSNEGIQEINLETQRRTEADLQDSFTRTINNSIQIKTLQKQGEEFKKFQNDITYEVREGRKKVEEKVDAAKKQANDALYETREGRKKLETQINEQNSNFKSLKSEFDKALKNIGSGFQEKITKTVSEIQSNLKNTDNQIKSANEKISVQAKIISDLQTGFKTVQGLPKTIDTKIAELKEFTIKLVNGKLQPVEVEQKKITQQINTIQQNGISRKDIEATNASLRKTYEQSFEFKAQQWQQEIQKQNNEFWNKKTKVTLSSNTKITQSNTEKITQLEKDNTRIKTDLDKIGKQIKEQEKVNQEAIPKLNSILNLIPLIPARVADNLKPSIPTIPQIETATGKAMCNSLKTGCGKKAIDDAVNNVNGNTNQNTGNILDAINTGANTAQLEMLNTINNKLGVQLPDGLSGTFGRLWQLLQIDRVINILTLITTMHNAAMLSRSVGETLFSGIDNIAQLAGFKWKNEKGEEVGFGGLVSEWTENFFKTIFGEDNYNNAKKSWNAANRMYQATTNMFYQVQGMFDSARSIAELTANNTGKIGNALKKGGAIFENAFPNMSENTTSKTAYQKKWDNIIEGLNNAEETVSAFSAITGEMVSIGENFNELKNQRDEFFKAKDDSEKAVTALINGEKEAAKVNQNVTKEHTQKSED